MTMGKKAKVDTRGVALGNRDEALPPSRPDSPGGQPSRETHRKRCPCGEYHALETEECFISYEDLIDAFDDEDLEDYVDIYGESCKVCGVENVDHTQFIMPCSPQDLIESYMQQYLTITPSGWVAADGPEGIIITATGREEYYILCNAEKQDRAAYGERWSWSCRRVGTKSDKCDDDYMKDISS